jgi:uncharacterized membrane protein YfcA
VAAARGSKKAREQGVYIISAFDPLYSLSGLFVGALVGMTGVGGGSLMTPLLVLLFGFHPATAVGTDLLFASVTKSVGTAVHGKRSTVEWRLVAGLAMGSVPASLLTLFVMSRVGTLSDSASGVLNLLLGSALLLTAVCTFFRPQIVRWAGPRIDQDDAQEIRRDTIILGAVLGILVTATSVGAGALGTTALLILYPRLPINKIAGSDIAHAVPLTFIAGLGHWFIGAIDFGLLLSLLVGSIPGVIIGSHFGSRVSDNVLRPVLAMTLLVVGLKMVW